MMPIHGGAVLVDKRDYQVPLKPFTASGSELRAQSKDFPNFARCPLPEMLLWDSGAGLFFFASRVEYLVDR